MEFVNGKDYIILYIPYMLANNPFMFQTTNQILSRCPFTKSLGAEASSFQMPSTRVVLVPTGPTAARERCGVPNGSRCWKFLGSEVAHTILIFMNNEGIGFSTQIPKSPSCPWCVSKRRSFCCFLLKFHGIVLWEIAGLVRKLIPPEPRYGKPGIDNH